MAGGHAPLSIEGTSTSQWILMDFGDVVVHIFRQDVREHYALERLWSDAKPVKLPAEGRALLPAAARPAPRKVRAKKRA